MTTVSHPSRLLVIDDNRADLALFEEAVGASGLTISLRTCANATQALEVLQTDRQFDLILSDLNMPVVSGVDFVHRLRKDPMLAAIPVALTSSSLRERLPARMATVLTDLGVPYFTKASTWTEFMRLVREIDEVLQDGRSGASARLLAERMTPATGFRKFCAPQ
jgi:CheY-like chemotaxis protein